MMRTHMEKREYDDWENATTQLLDKPLQKLIGTDPARVHNVFEVRVVPGKRGPAVRH